MNNAGTVRVFGRPESLPADFAAQHRSVLHWRLLAIVPCVAQPPWCFASEHGMTFLRLLGGRPGVLLTPRPGTCMPCPPILRVSGRPTDEQIAPLAIRTRASRRAIASHRETAASSWLQGSITTIATRSSPQSTYHYASLSPSSRLLHLSVGLAAVLLQGVS